MPELRFFIVGHTVPQTAKAHRIAETKEGDRKIVAYDPRKSEVRDWKHHVQTTALYFKTHSDFDLLPSGTPLGLDLTFYRLRPQSWPKSRAWWTQTPDWDNLSKSTVDALRRVLFEDDRSIVDIHVAKRIGVAPGCLVALLWGERWESLWLDTYPDMSDGLLNCWQRAKMLVAPQDTSRFVEAADGCG